LFRHLGRFFSESDTLTSAGRGKERYRRILLYFASAALPRTVGLLTPLITVPLTLNYLGVERFGLWMIIVSFLSLLGFADLGLGSGLVNALAEANGKDDAALARRYISSTFFMLVAIATLWALVFALSYPWLYWDRLLGLTDAVAVAEAGPAVVVFVACFLFNLPLTVLQRAQLGYQQGHLYNLWEAVGKLLGLGAVIFVVLQEVALPWLVLAFTGVPLLATLANGAIFFGRKYRWLTPRWQAVRAPIARQLLGIGTLFLIYQLAYSLGRASDNIILARVLGAEAVTVYVVPLRLFEIIVVIVMSYSAALWPAYREAVARRDMVWVKRTLLKSVVVTLALTGALCGTLVIWGDSILGVWVGSDVVVSLLMWIGLAIWTMVTALGLVMNAFLLGINAIRFQAITMGLFAVGAVFLKVVFAQSWGVSGLIGANILAYTTLIILPYMFAVRRGILELAH
jgi:O-antigen/teichoic acid export membrane protein